MNHFHVIWLKVSESDAHVHTQKMYKKALSLEHFTCLLIFFSIFVSNRVICTKCTCSFSFELRIDLCSLVSRVCIADVYYLREECVCTVEISDFTLSSDMVYLFKQ